MVLDGEATAQHGGPVNRQPGTARPGSWTEGLGLLSFGKAPDFSPGDVYAIMVVTGPAPAGPARPARRSALLPALKRRGFRAGRFYGVGWREATQGPPLRVHPPRPGETVLITDRDEVVAELRPAHRQGRAGLSIEERLDALAEAGELTRPSLPKGDWTWKVKGLGLPPGTAAQLLDEVRGDRL